MSKKNNNDRDQSWRKELGLDDGLDESKKKQNQKKKKNILVIGDKILA